MIKVKKKPNIANLPFQFSAELVNPQIQGKETLSFSIKSNKENFQT